ncbi:CFI-box-CTERM domain-containing protein [Ornithobacterium rhinotracheale]|uniref:CFI-box-CTERM domain-containing protein n=1 Tax=Ornithobacterium rhinotracheale TaxID=28251 RepID=UPI003FA4B5AD
MIESFLAKEVVKLSGVGIDVYQLDMLQRLQGGIPLSPASKYYIRLLSIAIIIDYIEQTNYCNLKRKINPLSFLNECSFEFQKVFNEYKEEFVSCGVQMKIGDAYLDQLLLLGNHMFLEMSEKSFRELFVIDVSAFEEDLIRFREGLKRYSLGQGKAYNPFEIFMSVFISPFHFNTISPVDRGFMAQIALGVLEGNSSSVLGQIYNGFIEIMDKHINAIIIILEDGKVKEAIKNEIYGSESQYKREACYVATLAYGDVNHPQVKYLRQVRDTKLLNYKFGKSFVQFYYKYSPKLVEVLRPYRAINKIIRLGLDTLIKIMKKIS